MIKVSIIIVYNLAKKELFDCLSSLRKIKVSHEVIIVDNDVPKKIERELKERFPNVRYFKSKGNIGYGAGNNLGAKHAKGEYIFFLNPDTLVLPGAVEKLAGFYEKNKNVGIVAPNLLREDQKPYEHVGTRALNPVSGIFALSFINKVWPGNPISKKYWLSGERHKNRKEVDVAPGTAFLIKKSLFDHIGGFDENFFIYFEECDLGKRIKEKGYKIYILPQSKVIHLWAKSTPDPRKRNKWFKQSRYFYFKKHYGGFWAKVVEAFATFGKNELYFLLIFFLAVFLIFYRLRYSSDK